MSKETSFTYIHTHTHSCLPNTHIKNISTHLNNSFAGNKLEKKKSLELLEWGKYIGKLIYASV